MASSSRANTASSAAQILQPADTSAQVGNPAGGPAAVPSAHVPAQRPQAQAPPAGLHLQGPPPHVRLVLAKSKLLLINI